MEIKLEKEPVYLSEVMFDGQTEQGVEFDYVLPDYYPDIFKILKCSLTPGIVSYSVSGTQLYCNGVVYIKVLYISAESAAINCVEQRFTYSKTIELGKSADKVMVRITPKTDYVNCRAVSGRRVDVRGAVSCKVRVTAYRETEIVSSAEGIETKKVPVIYCGDKLFADRQFVVREDIETGSDGISAVVYCDAFAEAFETKVIAGKVIIKGEAKVKALYIVRKDGEEYTEVMEANVPLSQIVDLAGVTETHMCSVMLTVMDCALELKADENGSVKTFGCDMTVDCSVSAVRENTVSVICDAYSTEYETDFAKTVLKAEFAPQYVKKQLVLKTPVECGEGELQEMCDCRCDISNVVCRKNEENEFILTGQYTVYGIGRLTSGAPVCIEKSQPFELSAELGSTDENAEIDPMCYVNDVGYSITGPDSVEARVSLTLEGCLFQTKNVEVIREITLNTDMPKKKDAEYALKMYYAEENEEIWNIAKRFNTSSLAIITENDLESEKLAASCMLLIPIV